MSLTAATTTAAAVDVVQGFSLTNRLLLYTSVLLAPAQYVSGLHTFFPTNLGFLAYNIYTQTQWLLATQKGNQLHALSMLLPHFNLVYAFSYLGGISSGTLFLGIPLGLGTAGVMLLNTAVAWISWKTNMVQGYGVYKFFFFGWRTLSPGWHKFLMVWQISDTLLAVPLSFAALFKAVQIAASNNGGGGGLHGEEEDEDKTGWRHYAQTWIAVPLGAAGVMLGLWTLIMWTELIIARNHIRSETDWVAVWLFVGQAGLMVVPPLKGVVWCFRARKNEDSPRFDGISKGLLSRFRKRTKDSSASDVMLKPVSTVHGVKP